MKKFIDQGILGLNSDELALLHVAELDLHQVRSEKIVSSFQNYKEKAAAFVAVSTFSKWSIKNCFLCEDGNICEVKPYWSVTAYDHHVYDVVLVDTYLHNHQKDSDPSLYYDAIDIANCYFESDVTRSALRIMGGDPYSDDFMFVEWQEDTKLRLKNIMKTK